MDRRASRGVALSLAAFAAVALAVYACAVNPVITSYSIHYTKLYEKKGERTAFLILIWTSPASAS